MTSDRRRLAWAPALLLLLASGIGTAWLGLQPVAGAPVAAIFPPWWDAERVFAAAASTGGAIVREGAWSNILVVAASDGDFHHRLLAAGAWLLVNPTALDGCFKEKT